MQQQYWQTVVGKQNYKLPRSLLLVKETKTIMHSIHQQLVIAEVEVEVEVSVKAPRIKDHKTDSSRLRRPWMSIERRSERKQTSESKKWQVRSAWRW